MPHSKHAVEAVSYSSRQFKLDLERLSKRILAWQMGDPLDAFLGIPRNGMIIAGGLSHAVANTASRMIPDVDEGWNKVPVVSLSDLAASPAKHKVMVVDDIWDTGKTLTQFLEQVKDLKHITVAGVVVLHARPGYQETSYKELVMAANPLTHFDGWVEYFWERYGQ